MTAFGVDLGALDEAIARMAAFEREVAGQVDDLDARARQVCGSWSGVAAEEYAAAHAAWARGARELHAALAVLRRAAATAHGNYGAAVTANRAMWP